jgi:hypothetical protein
VLSDYALVACSVRSIYTHCALRAARSICANAIGYCTRHENHETCTDGLSTGADSEFQRRVDYLLEGRDGLHALFRRHQEHGGSGSGRGERERSSGCKASPSDVDDDELTMNATHLRKAIAKLGGIGTHCIPQRDVEKMLRVSASVACSLSLGRSLAQSFSLTHTQSRARVLPPPPPACLPPCLPACLSLSLSLSPSPSLPPSLTLALSRHLLQVYDLNNNGLGYQEFVDMLHDLVQVPPY